MLISELGHTTRDIGDHAYPTDHDYYYEKSTGHTDRARSERHVFTTTVVFTNPFQRHQHVYASTPCCRSLLQDRKYLN